MINIENRDAEWIERNTARLMELMTQERIETFQRVLSMRTRYMTILTENTFHSQNSSALIRHCDAFGVMDIHAVENLCRFQAYHDIVRGSDKWIGINRYESSRQALHHLKESGYRIVATSPHKGGSTPELFDVMKSPFALVFGEEKSGISDEVIELSDEFIQIPMCGMVESLNVSASAAIIIYQLSEKIRHSTLDWQLGEDEKRNILFDWCMKSVRSSELIIEQI
ncbi:MAG: RNA methyltransferase [Rikenellaceae bacterium]